MRPRAMNTSKHRRTSSSMHSKRAADKVLQHQRVTQQKLRGRQDKARSKAKAKSNPNLKPKLPIYRFLYLAIQKAKRERWATLAEETQRIVLGDGKYVEERRIPVGSSSVTQAQQGPLGDPSASGSSQASSIVRVAHDIFAQVQLSRQGTVFYPHYSEALAKWATIPRRTAVPDPPGTSIEFTRSSTLTAAHRLSKAAQSTTTPSSSSLSTPIGVLSFASPKKPGGGFLHGGDEQEESIARHSSLVAALSSPTAQDFYKEHRKYRVEDGSGLHDHSMLYSPGVVVFRADADDNCDAPPEDAVGGAFIAPYTIDVVSAVPVNAAAVRAKHIILPDERDFFEQGIRSAMKERMARVLRAFEQRGDRTLVLGAFGLGSSENKVDTIGAIWAELLVCGDKPGEEARFKNVFDKVVFAVSGKFFEPFKQGYEMRILEADVEAAALSD